MDSAACDEDDEYSSGQKGFFFDDDEDPVAGTSKPSHSGIGQLDLLKSDGLDEAAENEIVERFLPLNIQDTSPVDFQNQAKSTTAKANALETVENIIFNFDYSLAPFKGKEEKIELLNAAVQSHDGNAILTVVLFLKRTLKKSIFQREVMKFPDAVNMYLSYLEEDHETDELINILMLLDRTEDAAMFKYSSGVSIHQPDRKMKWIENCLNTHFQTGMVDRFYTESLLEHQQLIKDEIALEDHRRAESSSEEEAFQVFHSLCARQRLLDSPLVSCYVFCVLHYYNVPEIAFVSPASVKSRYNLTKKQITWGALRALAFTQRWKELQDLFTTKSWLGGAKMKSCIGFTKVVQVLTEMKAPIDVIAKYISHVEDADMKLDLAKKHHCHSLVIDIFKNSKDRRGLMDYASKLTQHSVDYINANEILNSPAVKWKN